MSIKRDFASYRDPSGHVYNSDDQIFRTVTAYAKAEYEYVRDNKALKKIQDKNWVIAAKEININQIIENFPDVIKKDLFYIIEHPKIPFISYPYEWSFSLLKAAALRHLEIQMELLNGGIALSDASAYNIQFINGINPIFIDYLSFRPYTEGDFWLGHRQFCEQFLNPLLLRAYSGVSHNSWYRGNLEGITTRDIRKLLPFYRKLSFRVLMHIILPDKYQSKVTGDNKINKDRINKTKLPKTGYSGMLNQLHNWIAGLSPLDKADTTWSNYVNTHTYSKEDESKKHNFIKEFITRTKPEFVIDMGCNTGEYSETALLSGAKRVVGFDYDQGALELAYERAKTRNLNFLPLFLDAANPSPGQGWRGLERTGLSDRMKVDAVIALAFEHHLAIARNLSLDEIVDWLVAIAPEGIIEFVQKDDPTIQIMLSIRDDIFPDYNEENFKNVLEKRAKIIKEETVSNTNRRLYWFERI